MLPVRVYVNQLGGACGVAHMSTFTRFGHDELPKKISKRMGGCGWIGGGFVNTPECKEVYDEMNKYYKLVFQTPVRLNRNSGREFFYAMWDRR